MADNLTYDEAVNEEQIFLVTGEEDSDEGPTTFYNSMDEVEDHLKNIHVSLDSGAKVLHGILTTAQYLPTSFRGRTAFVVIRNPEDPFLSAVIESGASTPEELAEEIESFLLGGNVGITIPEIEDIYIFYGYELTVCLAVDWDDLDDESLHRCQQVGADAIEVGEKDRKGD